MFGCSTSLNKNELLKGEHFCETRGVREFKTHHKRVFCLNGEEESLVKITLQLTTNV